MAVLTMNEIGERGEVLYQSLQGEVPAGSDGKFIVIDVLSSNSEIGDDPLETIHQPRDRVPNAQPYSKKILFNHGLFCQSIAH